VVLDDQNEPSESNIETGGKGNTGGKGGTGGTADKGTDDTCLSTINSFRSKVGLPPYERWTKAETCAADQAKSDSQTGTGHGAFARCGELAQNECPAFPSASPSQALSACLAAMWQEGPGGGHYDTMTSKQYTKVACGVFVTASGQTWAVQDFR